jgi:hypothetical protein
MKQDLDAQIHVAARLDDRPHPHNPQTFSIGGPLAGTQIQIGKRDELPHEHL